MIKRYNILKRIWSETERSKRDDFKHAKWKYKKSQKDNTPKMATLNKAVVKQFGKDKTKKTKDIFKLGK